MKNKPIIVYFSRKGENYWNGAIKNLKKGNTEIVAEKIAALVHGDLFEIEPVHSYDSDYSRCIQEAKEEKNSDARPEIRPVPDNIAEYEEIYLGYPNWWSTVPMPVLTFLEQLSDRNITIYPFCTNEGSGLGSSVDDIRRVCPSATVKPGLSIIGHEVHTSDDRIERWISSQK